MYTLLAFFGVGLLAWLVQSLVTASRRRRMAKQLGCEDVFRRKSRLPLGIDFIQAIAKADRENAVPNHFVETYERLGRRNTWTQNLLGRDATMTVAPENIKAMLATQFKDFELGPIRKGAFSPLFANGIFSDDGARWEHSRAMIRPQFVRDQIQDVTQLEQHVQNLMAALTAGVDSNGWTAPQDIVPLFFRETLDSSTEFLFGQSVESQLAALREKQSTGYHPPGGHPTGGQLAWEKFGPAFDTATMEMAQRFRYNGMYFLHNTKKMRNACKEVHRFADHFVKQALESPPEKSLEKDSKQPYVFLHELVKSTRDPIELRDQVLNVLLAGRDTTAGLMAFVMYELARHPHIFAKLRSAVLNDFGTYDNPRNMDFSGLKACSYLQQVLNEGLRLHPSVPINGRRTVRDTTLPVGGGPDQKSPIFLPKGSEVNYSVHVMHRRVDLWGEDANLFRPERWENRRPGWDFVPFNGGPRICLGQQFALTSAGYTIARICQRFDQFADLVPHTPNSDEEKYGCSVTVGPVHVQVRLHEAQNA